MKRRGPRIARGATWLFVEKTFLRARGRASLDSPGGWKMRISTQLGYAGGFHEAVEEVREFEKAGLDTVWVAEAWGFDAVSFMETI